MQVAVQSDSVTHVPSWAMEGVFDILSNLSVLIYVTVQLRGAAVLTAALTFPHFVSEQHHSHRGFFPQFHLLISIGKVKVLPAKLSFSPLFSFFLKIKPAH